MDQPATPSLASAPSCFGPFCVLMPKAVKEARWTENERWFRTEVEPHAAALLNYLRSRFAQLSDPEDILHDCYLRLLKLRQQGPLPITRAYLFVVARNAALDRIRRSRIVRMDSLDQSSVSSVIEEKADAADQLCHAEELQLLEEAVRDLPPRCRDVVSLRRFHGLSYSEIGRRLQITESTVHAQLAIALNRCRDYLRQHGVARTSPHVRDAS